MKPVSRDTTKRACFYTLLMLVVPPLAPIILVFLVLRWLIKKGDK